MNAVMQFTKCCTKCHRQLPVERFSTVRFRLSTGGIGTSTRGTCRECISRRDRESERRRLVKPTSKDPRVLAVEIAEVAGTHRVVVFRRGGAIQWRPAKDRLPAGVELIGTYDHGADRRWIHADLCA